MYRDTLFFALNVLLYKTGVNLLIFVLCKNYNNELFFKEVILSCDLVL